MAADIGQTKEVQSFMGKVELFGGNFTGVDTELDTEVDQKVVQNAYLEAITAYKNMTKKLGFENEFL
jgi:hypothetical protein